MAQVSHNFCLALMFVSNLLLAAEKKKSKHTKLLPISSLWRGPFLVDAGFAF